MPDGIGHHNLINVPDDAMVDLANDSTGQLQDTAKPTVDSRDAVVEHTWMYLLRVGVLCLLLPGYRL